MPKLIKNSRFTNREKEILELLKEGLTSKQIAEKLFICMETVKTHRKHILEKGAVHKTCKLITEITKNSTPPRDDLTFSWLNIPLLGYFLEGYTAIGLQNYLTFKRNIKICQHQLMEF